MIRRKLIVLVVALVAALGLKAQPNTLYFMEDVALRHHLNPSFMPSASWFFEIPIFPSFYGEVGNNIWRMVYRLCFYGEPRQVLQAYGEYQ